MWVEIGLGVTIIILIMLMVAIQNAANAKMGAVDLTPEGTCPDCPNSQIVSMKISSSGATMQTSIPAIIPPLPSGVTNGQFIRDSQTGAIYYVQNGTLSYVASPTILVKMGYQAPSSTYSTQTITTCAFGPPILS